MSNIFEGDLREYRELRPMNTAEVMKRGMEYYGKLEESGFKPYILGSAWLKLKLPSFDILVHDLDLYCPDFDPTRSPFEVARIEGRTESYSVPYHWLMIIKQFENPIEEVELEVWNGRYMVKNSFWLARVLNKIANFISRQPNDPLRLKDEYSILIPLVNCYIFYFAGLEFDVMDVARMLSSDRFTNSRIAHLYNYNTAFAAAVLARKYYYFPQSPEEILTEFCNKLIKPICIELGTYDRESTEPSGLGP